MRPVIVTALAPGAGPALAWSEATMRARRMHADLVAIRIEPAADAVALLEDLAEEYPRRRADTLCTARLDLVIARGDVTGEIVRTARLDGADLIVVGEDLWPPAQVARQVAYLVRHARCQVMIVRAVASTGIVVGGVDPSGSSDHVMTAIAEESSSHPRGFAFVLAAAPPRVADRARARLHALQQRHRVRGVVVIADGAPGPMLVDSARELCAELAVVGSTRDAGEGHRLGETASEVVAHAPCSVLVIPPPPILTIWARAGGQRPRG